MKNLWKRGLALCLCLCLLGGLPFEAMPAAEAANYIDTLPQLHYGEYETQAMIYDGYDCYSMQGMTLDNNYLYCAKIGSNDAVATITRISKTDGSKAYMTNADNGSYVFYNLGHANALDVVWLNGCNQMFVTAGATLVRLTMSGSQLKTAGTYTATYNGATASMTAVQLMSTSANEVKVLVKTGRTLYTGTLDPNASSGNIELTRLCTLNLSSARLKGEICNFSSWTQQGFAYYDNKLFLPLFANTTEQINTSVVLVYDLEGAAGDVLNDPTLSFRIISGTYSALFEIEDVAICQETGRLYFNTNRRKTDYDTDYDSCSYFLGYAYDPAMSAVAPADYRWETQSNEFVCVMDGGNTFNHASRFYGHITDNVMTQNLYSLNRSVMLNHDDPWVVEWKSSGDFTGGALLLAAAKNSKVVDQPFLLRYQKSGVIALGSYTGSQHNNYGVSLAEHGIDGTAEHVYRLTNKINADGSNMVYLSVDGKELGAMNNYYIGINKQGTTGNWVSGKDFAFSYIGSYNHPISGKLDYLQVWAQGAPDSTAGEYRWETSGDAFTPVTGGNTPYIYNGSISGGVYTDACFRLTDAVKLMHDRPWAVEWQSEGSISGGTFLLSAAEGGMATGAPFIFRYGNSGLLAIGCYDGSRHANCGINLSDHSIDTTQLHTYRLTNRIASDGSNMVYLSVDGEELGPMNNLYSGLNATGTTSDWLNGRDLVFDYVGNRSYAVKGTYSYLQVWESAQTCTAEFRDYDGTLISSGTYPVGQTPAVPSDPVRASDGQYSYTFAGWSPAVGPLTEDTVYTATYNAILSGYTVTFCNDDGTVLKTQSVAYGTVPTAPAAPTKAGTTQYSYVFAGWDKPLTAVTGDVTYTATYTQVLNSYTVTFCNDDGTVLSTQSVAYGSVPAAPAAPTKAATAQYSYTFTGWDKALTAITGNVTYTAKYARTVRRYTVTFKNADGTVLQTQTLAYGDTPIAPAAPTKAADNQYRYSFAGWTPTVGAVTGPVTYTPMYTTVSHSYSQKVVAPTCTAKGYTTYTCTDCGHSYTANEVAARGHSYAGGVCTLCGAKDPNYVLQPTVTLKYPTLTFEDVILMNVYFAASDLENVLEMGLLTYSAPVSSASISTADAVIPGYTWSAADGLYYATTKGIAAKDLGDEIYFAVYAKLADGTYTYTRVVSYSPAKYAYASLSTGSAAMKPIVVAMLNYGAAAQNYFNYKTDDLVNASLTDAQKALVENYRGDMIASVASPSASKQGALALNGGFARRYPTVSFEGAFCINYYATPSVTPADGITMYYWSQEDYDGAEVLTLANATKAIRMNGSGTGEYHAAVEGIAAKDLSRGVYVCFVYSSGSATYYSGVLAYSIGTYCATQANGSGTAAALAKATAVYGYYANELFNK